MKIEGKISTPIAVLMSLNVVMGAAIYVLPGMMTRIAGSVSFLGWIIGAALMFPIVWTIALASRMFPGPGGFYNYCFAGLNKTAAFLALWAYVLGFFAVASTQLFAFKRFLFGCFDLTSLEHMPIATNIAFILILLVLNLFTVKAISYMQSAAMAVKLIPFIVVIALTPFYWDSSITYHLSDMSMLGATLPLALFGYWCFESCTSLSEYIEDGPTKVSRVILIAFSICVALYCFFQLGLTHIMGVENLGTLGAKDFPSFLGIADGSIVAALRLGVLCILLLTMFNGIYGVMFGNIANLFYLARHGHLFASELVCQVNHYQRPTYLIHIQSLIILLIISCIPHLLILVAIGNLGLIVANLFAITAVLRVQWQKKQRYGMIVSVLALCSCGLLTFFTWHLIEQNVIFLIPFVVAMILGYGMFKIRERANHL